MPLPQGARLGRYEIVAMLGAGAMGEVYRAHDPQLDRDVAIKILPDAFSQDADRAWRFQREARAVASLNHPNICTVHDIGEHEGHQYLVMELLAGQPLNDRLASGPVPMPALVELSIQMADALDAAHGAGVIHRDLKPANIFLTRRGEAKLLDFGLAKLSEPDARPDAAGGTIPPTDFSSAGTMLAVEQTTVGMVLGTAAYMSPEQARGETADAQSDLFSLGLVLYEMAAGQPAFTGKTPALLFDAILNRDPQPLAECRPGLPPEISIIVSKALEKERDLRYRTAADLRTDLKRVRRNATSSGHGETTSHVEAQPESAAATASAPRSSGISAIGSGGVGAVTSTRSVLLLVLALVVLSAAAYVALRSRSAESDTFAIDQIQVTQLTSTGNAARPALSPDGKYIVYLQSDGDTGSSVWLRQTGATNSVRILPGEAGRTVMGATIGPDSTFVDVVRGLTLWRVPFLGGTPKQIVDPIAMPIGWSPDGQRIAYLRPTAGGRDMFGRGVDLVVANHDGNDQRVLSTRVAPMGFVVTIPGSTSVPPAWSPDGQSVAVLQRLGDDVRQMGVAVYPVNGGAMQTVAITGDVPLGLAWLDAGTLLVVQALEQGTPSQVWRITYPGGRRLRLTNDVNRYSELSLSADRGSFVTSRPETRVSIWVGNASGEGRDVVTAAPFLSAAAVYATVGWDGPRVLFTHTLNGHFEIFGMPADGSGSPEAIVAGRDFAAAPDGHIVYRSLTGNDVGLWRVDRDGRNPLQLAPGSVNFPNVTRDGRDVVFSSPATGQQTVWRVPLAGGPGSPLLQEPIGLAGFSDVSPDGHSILMYRNGGWIVCDYPACIENRPMPVRGQFVRWVPNGLAISTVIQDSAGNSNVWIHPLDGSASRQITHFTDGRFIGHYAWSSDAARLAISRVSFSSDIVLFRNLPRRSQ